MSEDNQTVLYLVGILSIVLSFSLWLIDSTHKTDKKIECLKSLSKQCYTKDDIYELCGV